ncbi:hypothetical protein ACPB8Q_00010 [Methanocaldococcus indicus]|uniref:hypothetical protein n=1 Tax=Methanocaldococcus indicus TaxID=213231 RepID=UPI003C6D1E62
MKKLLTILILLFCFLNVNLAIDYKYITTIPIKVVDLNNINSKEELDKYLNDNSSLIIFYINDTPQDKLIYLGIKKVVPTKIPDFYNYTYISTNGIFVIYKKYTVYRDENGAYIFNPPVKVEDKKYEFIKPYKIKVPNPDSIPEYDGYTLLVNGTFIIYPKKYIIRGEDGLYIYIPPANLTEKYKEILTYNPPRQKPEDYGYVFIDKNGNFIVYPKKYYYIENGVIYYHPLWKYNETPIFKLNYSEIAPGVYEIKKNKLLFLYPTTLNDKNTLDIIGSYIAKEGGIFVYINKVPPYYKHILACGVGIQRIKPDEKGDYAISVADRKIKVDYLNEKIINIKLKQIKALKALGINVSYIITGDEGIKLVEKANVDINELEDLLNEYWFKKYYTNYTHLYFSPNYIENINNNYDLVGLSFYPLIYLQKAPYTFENDPVGDIYPKTISYKGTDENGYWEESPESKNILYHASKDEPYWDGCYKDSSHWFYEGKAVDEKTNSEFWEKYKEFNYWYVKNYAYLLTKCDALFLISSDKYLVDAILGKDNEDLDYKLDIDGANLSYIIIPNKKGFELYNNIPIIFVPTPFYEKYDVPILNVTYIPPKDEEFGVYIANIDKFNTTLLLKLKENGTDIVSFKELANFLKRYYKNSLRFENNRKILYIKDTNNFKITIFKKNFDYSLYNVESVDNENYKYVIDNPPHYVYLG